MNDMDNRPVKVLLVGGGDRSRAMTELAQRMGIALECACPGAEHVSVRDLVRELARSGAAQDGVEGGLLHRLLCRGDWDVILLRQFVPSSGLTSTMNADVECLLDYFAHRCPTARVYWDMPWAFGPGSTVYPGYFDRYYDSNTACMYNAICGVVESCILRGEFSPRFSGWIPTGAVVQQLRERWGTEPTLDGFHLAGDAQLADVLTALHVLFPRGELELAAAGAGERGAELCRIVRSCCSDLTCAPAPVDAPTPGRIEEYGMENTFTALQAKAPLAFYFPDMVCLRDGRMLLAVYEHNCHVPFSAPYHDNYAHPGPGRILVLEGTADGRSWDYEHPLLVVDEAYVARHNIVQTRGRYQRLRRGEKDYCIISDPRDPNLGLVRADVTGDGKKGEVIVLTFWMCNYYPELSDHEVFTIQSTDGGRTWYPPQRMEREDGLIPLKRGDIAVFDNGEILFPYYSLRRQSSRVGALHLRWDVNRHRWERMGDYEIPNTAPWEGNSYNFNEVSLVIPDRENEEVFAFIRESGVVMRSRDRGQTWQEVGCEPGLIHQPGFALMEANRVFTSWARSRIPRTIYAKAFYPKAGWDQTLTQQVYASPVTAAHDMADPSCKQLADGRVLVYCYDTAFRSIIGTVLDPDKECCLPIELQRSIPMGLLAQGDLGRSEPCGEVLVPSLPTSATLQLEVDAVPGGELTITMGSAGSVLFRAGENGLVARGSGSIYLAMAGELLWSRFDERDAWTPVLPCANGGEEGLRVRAKGVRVGSWQLTRRVSIRMDRELWTVEHGPDIVPEPVLQPRCDRVVYRCLDEAVARVDEEGVLHVGRPGTTQLLVEADGVQATCQVHVMEAAEQLLCPGKELFRGSFDGVDPGTDAFISRCGEQGYVLQTEAGTHPRRGYDIISGEAGRHLMLRSGMSQPASFAIDRRFHGDFTLQFDYYFTHPRTATSSILTSPGQMLRVDLFHGSRVCGVVQLTPEGVRIEHRSREGGPIATAPEKFCWENVYPLNSWHRAKLVRIRGGICVKIWPRSGPEPERLSYVLMSPELVSEEATDIAFTYEVQLSPGQQLALDNILVTGQDE